MIEDLTGFLAVFLSLGIPVVAIIAGCISSIRKRNGENELRRIIIENNVDIERAKLLMDEPERRSGKYGMLRGGAIMAGMGLGALADYLLGIGVYNVYFYLILAVGMGVGMLVAFFVEMRMAEKKEEEMKNDE